MPIKVLNNYFIGRVMYITRQVYGLHGLLIKKQTRKVFQKTFKMSSSSPIQGCFIEKVEVVSRLREGTNTAVKYE